MPTYNQLSTVWFAESTNPDVTHYEIDVYKDGIQLGSAQIISTDDTVDGYDVVVGEIELYLGSLTALPNDATGEHSIYIYAVDPLGRSELPLNIFNVDINFVTNRRLPTAQDKTGILLKNATQPYFDSAFPAGDR